MVKLRLRRRGRKKAPFYDIVVIDGRARRDGASIERVGFIDPMTSPKSINLNVDRALYWLGVGAQPTEVVREILSREGVLLRRHLGLKGHSEAEIEAAIITHRERSAAAWKRRNELRVKRAAAKVAAANAPVAEVAAPVEAAPVVAAPVEAAPVEAAPVEAAPVEAAPVEAAAVEAAPAEVAPADTATTDVAAEPAVDSPTAE